jgi:hypothetical protein
VAFEKKLAGISKCLLLIWEMLVVMWMRSSHAHFEAFTPHTLAILLPYWLEHMYLCEAWELSCDIKTWYPKTIEHARPRFGFLVKDIHCGEVTCDRTVKHILYSGEV